MKKSFKGMENPAMQYVEKKEPENTGATYDEIRNRNVHLLFTQSFYDMAKADAKKADMSLNAYIEYLINRNHR